MANKNSRGRKNARGTKKEFKNQDYKMRGVVEKCDTFGKDLEHCWFSLKDDVNGTKYVFRFFNIPDEKYDVLMSANHIEVYFNIGYNSYNENIILQLVATDLFEIGED